MAHIKQSYSDEVGGILDEVYIERLLEECQMLRKINGRKEGSKNYVNILALKMYKRKEEKAARKKRAIHE